MDLNFGLREVVNLLFKHKLKIMTIFFLVLGISYILSTRLPITYTAKAVIMVNPGREFLLIPEVGDIRPSAPSQDTIINTEMQLISGSVLINRVIAMIGVENMYPSQENSRRSKTALEESARLKVNRNLTVTKIDRSNLIEVQFRHGNPEMAARTLNALVACLKERHLQVFRNVNSSFLGEQLKSYEEKLQNSQRSLAMFKERELLSEEQGSILLKRRSEVDTELSREMSRLAELRQKLKFVKSRPAMFFSSGNDLRNQLNVLRRKEQELAQKYNDESSAMITVRDDIAVVEKQLNEQEENVRNAEYLKIEAEITPLELKIANLRQQLQHLDHQLLVFNKNAVHLQDLKREIAGNESNYQTYLKKTEEARISENMDERKMTNITIVQEPHVPITPDKQNGEKIIRVGLILALAFSLGTAFILEFVPQTFSTPDSVRKKLGVPLLATLEHNKLATLLLFMSLTLTPGIALCAPLLFH